MAARTSCEINLPCKRYALVLLVIEEFVNFCENNLTVDNLDALLLPAFPAKLGARQALEPETALLLSGTQGRGIDLNTYYLILFSFLTLSNFLALLTRD